MLYLNPPYHIIRGVTIYPDHADPLQFYYLPAMPRLTTEFDPEANVAVPQLQLLRFTGSAGSGGFLTFSVNLGIDEAVLDDVRAELRSLMHLADTPRLAPVVLEDGRVRLMILGKATPEPPPAGGGPAPPPPPAPEGMPPFVLKIDHSAKPSLYGDNQATFSVQLDESGTTIIEKSLEAELMPAGIVYSLEFLALRPAYNVRVTADWNRVQKHFHQSFGASVFFFSTQVDKVIDKLIEDQVIKIEIDTFVPEGEDQAGVIGRRDLAVNEVKDMVFDTFFQPSLNPVKEEKDGWDKFNDTAMRLNTLAVTGGWASVATVSHKEVDLTRIDKKRLDVNMSERTTVRRSIYPQAHLKGLFRVLRDGAGQIDLDRFVKSVDLDDPFFRRRTVRVINRANLAGDGIASISVSLDYNGVHKDVMLDASAERGTADWTSLLQNGRMARDVTTSYKVTFKDVDTTERPGVLRAPATVFTQDDLEINPRADGLYHIVNVPVSVPGEFPWDAYPQVEVRLRYADPANAVALDEGFLLDKGAPEKRWPLFVRDRSRTAFDYQLVFRAKDHRDWSQDWITTTDEQILVRDPRPDRRTVHLVAAVSWDVVSMIFVDVSYRDDANGVRKEETFVFENTAEGKARKVFSVALANPDHRVVVYSVRMLLADNSVVELPPSMTLAREIFLRADMRGHRVVTVQTDGTDFAARKVDRVTVAAKYEDAPNGLSYASQFVFRSAGDKGFFEFDYVDPQRGAYEVQATTVFTDGFTVARDPERLDSDLARIRIG